MPLVDEAWGAALDLGKLLEQPGGIAWFPADGAGEAQVVGQRLGTAALAEHLGQGPGIDGLIERPIRLQADHAVQAGDRLAIVSHARPGREPGCTRRRSRMGSSAASRPNRSAVASRSSASRPCIRSSQTARRAGSAGSRNRYAVRAASGKSAADSRVAKACMATDESGSAAQRTLPASPGGQGPLALQMIPAFVDQGRRSIAVWESLTSAGVPS